MPQLQDASENPVLVGEWLLKVASSPVNLVTKRMLYQ